MGEGILGPTSLPLMDFPIPSYSHLVSVAPIAPHSTATNSMLVSKISVSAHIGPEGVGKSQRWFHTTSLESKFYNGVSISLAFSQLFLDALTYS